MLAARSITVSRAGRRVLENLSFTVEAGQALILRGPNGSGKTSLLRTLAGIEPLAGGEITQPEDQSLYASHKDGVKTQLTVRENLEFWADIYGGDTPPALYDWFDLGALKNRLAGSLSAGQLRRVGLARLGAVSRRIFYLDEPTVSLDQASSERFARFLRDHHLRAGGIAVIATHINLGLDAPVLELGGYAVCGALKGSDEAFL